MPTDPAAVTLPLHNRPAAYFMNRVLPKLQLTRAPQDIWIQGVGFAQDPQADEQKLLAGGFVIVSADYTKNALTLTGPEAKVAQLKEALAKFDIRPVFIELSLSIANPMEDAPFSSSAVIENGATWNTGVDFGGVTGSIKARADSAGVIWVSVTVGQEAKSTSFALKLLSGQSKHLRIEPQRARVGSLDPAQSVIHTDPNIELTIAAKVVAAPKQISGANGTGA